jgi:tight adherence protein B
VVRRSVDVTGLVCALLGAYGVHLLFTGVVLGWRGMGPGPKVAGRRGRSRLAAWMDEADLQQVRPPEVVGAAALLLVVGVVLGWALFGGVVAPAAVGLALLVMPGMAARSRWARRRSEAREAWPRLIEELRIKTSTLGRSIPQALFEVGRRAPDELQPAFEDARREWALTTDFERTVEVLRRRLADATADAVCETLLVAHQIGGNDVDRCLAALVEDRVLDLQGRKDAQARQAGARFARWFTVVVPALMALVGMSIGEGRRAYASTTGQLLTGVAVAVMVACWMWAGWIMRLPEERRVFAGGHSR